MSLSATIQSQLSSTRTTYEESKAGLIIEVRDYICRLLSSSLVQLSSSLRPLLVFVSVSRFAISQSFRLSRVCQFSLLHMQTVLDSLSPYF
jgi:hypothetical protein